ncbi:dihydroneopterin aldolase [Virgibacillus halophilus]|uniref:7,8-dihydroneopterin aldolase n=1 Tax=Tigheibacillus halophilus TaxID=361280 RepID=A0ABU5C6B2_9BACI|nr:dihydroneopterin aldolase [Virgibacillus halophilus]
MACLFYGYHGLFPEENKLGQPFIADVTLFLDLRAAGQTDEMNDSVDYGQVYGLIKERVEGEAKNLIESLAEDVASDLLRSFELVQACKVRITKPNPPIAGHYESVSAEIYRERQK